MTRVELLEAHQAPLLARAYYAQDGATSPVTRALAQVPELLEVAMPFIARVFGPTSLDLRTKEIVVLRVSVRNGCRYCIDTHTVAAWDAGCSVEDTARLREGRAAAPEASPRERALVEWCDAFAAAPDPVPVDVSSSLREHFSEHELVELALLAGATAMLNRFCTALELPTSAATLARLSNEDVSPVAPPVAPRGAQARGGQA
jgi:AhpD family alkylhydroperoxidase